MRLHITTGCWLLVLGCSAGAIPEGEAQGTPESQNEAPIASLEEELVLSANRKITVDFYLLHGSGQNPTATRADIDNAFAFANRIWEPAGIQWQLGSMKTVETTYLHDIGKPPVTWANVKNDAIALGIKSVAFSNNRIGSIFEWRSVLATHLPVSHVPVFITMDTSGKSCSSAMPHNDGLPEPAWPGVTDTSHIVMCKDAGRDFKTLAHEFGHFLGLAHTFDVTAGWVIDRTGIPAHEYYDLVFEPTTSGGGVKVFTSAAAASQATSLLPKDDNLTCRAAVCSENNLNCNTSCTLNGRTYDSTSFELSGLTFGKWGTPDYGVNVMSYQCHYCRLELSTSQMHVVDKFLMGAQGQRYLLGGPAASRGDFERDGLGDIAVTGIASWQAVPIARSQNNGKFSIVQNLASPNFNSFSSQSGAKTVAGDFNGDGRLDLAATGVSWWTTNPVATSLGGGIFNVTNHASANFNVYSSQPGASVLSGDFNGDGLTDLLAIGGVGWTTVPIAYSKGNGEFTITNRAMGTDFNVFARASNAEVLVGDFDGNGTSDLVATGNPGWNTLPVAFSNGDGTWRFTNLTCDFNAYTSQAGARVLAGDFNGDGKSDLVATGGAGWSTTPVTFSHGDGRFSTANRVDIGGNFNAFTSQAGVQVLALDYDGDGRTDLVATGGAGWNTTPIAKRTTSSTFYITNVSDGLNAYTQQAGARAFSL